VSIGASVGTLEDIGISEERLEVDRDERLEADLVERLEIDLGDSGSEGNRNLEERDDNDGGRVDVAVRGDGSEGEDGDCCVPSRTTMSVRCRFFFSKRPET